MDITKARKGTTDLFSALHNNAKSWKRFCILEAVIIVFLILGLIIVAAISKPYPWIVQVDEHGYEISVGAAGTQEIDIRILISRIGRFLESSRSVLSDPKGQRALIDWTYTTIPDGSPALATTNTYYQTHDPFKMAQKQETVQVAVKSILPKSEKVFQAEWEETHFKNGIPFETQRWTGLFTIGITPTTDIKNIIKNPLGIYIVEYSATQNYQ